MVFRAGCGDQYNKKVTGKLLQSVNNNGKFYTNHSLRRTSATRLFQTGVEHKLVKEVTGHTSDAIDKYQITSDEQRETVSKVYDCPTVEIDLSKKR